MNIITFATTFKIAIGVIVLLQVLILMRDAQESKKEFRKSLPYFVWEIGFIIMIFYFVNIKEQEYLSAQTVNEEVTKCEVVNEDTKNEAELQTITVGDKKYQLVPIE